VVTKFQDTMNVHLKKEVAITFLVITMTNP